MRSFSLGNRQKPGEEIEAPGACLEGAGFDGKESPTENAGQCGQGRPE